MSLHNHRLSFLAGAALALTLGTAQAQNSANPSPTVAQTVKPPPDTATPDKASGMSNSGTMADKQTMKRQHKSEKKRMKSTHGSSSSTTDTSAVGGGSGGTTPGRVANTTNSNAKGEPGKTP